jgi:hypothetical protein
MTKLNSLDLDIPVLDKQWLELGILLEENVSLNEPRGRFLDLVTGVNTSRDAKHLIELLQCQPLCLGHP